ncbi:hypothetical protein Q7M48_05510 (plasmid) [Candidatus Liberibacter asiaticus]|uniref:hypothetical protein n=1 Tax=Liberibacter asiaticus TaxID=34021 RepID=UPI0009460FB6|nr:hypothetical protein [Candidatus Liberibacter asiaticus]APD21503.1 hypothetical protein PHHCA_gp28 [Liberibacter phage HHCA1-2]QOI69869.1 hypothetical protein PPA191_gp28 [Liberibacter phage P-PA19-1]KAE9517051.1 hypothetical protein FXW24_05440 [Candidatus Liberibacter asiaticus]QGA30533.1 hypothetical protein CD16_05505 [Candidatus Liberibacter asiaticus]QNF77004.1 hypothetical protein FML99_05575 [Candidatus Liberibacter asiaticus]
MTNTPWNGTKFDVLTRRIADQDSVLILRLGLGTVSEDILRHIELEAKDSANELLKPLRKIIDELVEKRERIKNSSRSDNPDDDMCEVCQ